MSAHGNGEGLHHHAVFVAALATLEGIAAVALLIEPTERFAAGGLLAVFAVASVVSAMSFDWLAILRFFFYATTAWYIVFAHPRSATDIARDAG